MGLRVSFSPRIVHWCCADWAAGLVVVPAKCVWVCVNVCSPQRAHAVHHMVGCVYACVCVWRGGGTWFYFDGKGGSSWMWAKATQKKGKTKLTHTGQISEWPFKWGWVSRAFGQATTAFYQSFTSAVCAHRQEQGVFQPATTTSD